MVKSICERLDEVKELMDNATFDCVADEGRVIELVDSIIEDLTNNNKETPTKGIQVFGFMSKKGA